MELGDFIRVPPDARRIGAGKMHEVRVSSTVFPLSHTYQFSLDHNVPHSSSSVRASNVEGLRVSNTLLFFSCLNYTK